MPSLGIVSDRNVPGIEQAAPTLAGEVSLRLLPSSAIDAAAVADADLLFVRSTVRCGEALLGRSRVRLVATATIGTDHLDLPWLAARGVQVASAPGCNADSVVQWLAAALCRLRRRRPEALRGAVAGVVGIGNVGARVARLLSALGMEVLRCDPPRRRAGLPGGPYQDLDELCRRCDLLTLHVPLSHEGPDRTAGLLDERRLDLLPARAVVVNACRGEVTGGAVLRAAAASGRTVLLDVFPGEPSPDPALVAAAELATPHVAGHSLEGKVRGTEMVYQAACAFLGVAPTWRPGEALLPENPLSGLVVRCAGSDDWDVLDDLLRRSYDLEADDAALRRIVALPEAERGPAFRSYREGYPVRRELTGARLVLDDQADRPRLRAVLGALGARL